MLPKLIYTASAGHAVIAEDTKPRTYTVREVGHSKRPFCTCTSERAAVAIANALSSAAALYELVSYVREEGGGEVLIYAPDPE